MEPSDYYIHDINPMIPIVEIPYYWLVYVMGIFFLWWIARWLIRSRLSNVNEADFIDYLLVGWFSMLVGSRLFYVFFYNWEYYRHQISEIFRFWNGGMSFHGGLIGVALGLLAISFFKKKPLLSATDLAVTGVPLVIGFGRIANFINGELAGRVTSVSWAVIFPRYIDQMPRHPSQLYQAALEGFLLFAVMLKTRAKLKFEGYQTAQFLFLYGLFRLIAEWFREPDPQIGYLVYGLTFGQVLCIFMMVFAISLYGVKVRKSARGQT